MHYFFIPPALKALAKNFILHGYSCYLVGGAVRNMLLHLPVTDYDIATNATPPQVMRLFRRVIPTGIKHGTVTVLFQNSSYEVTTYRTDGNYQDGRHPESVSFCATIEEDLSRRDFTINALAISLTDYSLLDFFNGEGDIKNKVIRTVGDPLSRFTEDGLRPIRALRFMAQLSFTIEAGTLAAISNPAVQEKIKTVSIERFRDELAKILLSKKPSSSLRLMQELGILFFFIPSLSPTLNCTQADIRSFHKFDVFNHLLTSSDAVTNYPQPNPADNLILALATLFHDIGKPACKEVKTEGGEEINTFYNHEKEGARIAREALVSLKFPNEVVDKVCHLIECHMFNYTRDWSDSAIRRFIKTVGSTNIPLLLDLRLCDIYGMQGVPVRTHDTETGSLLVEFSDRIKKIGEEKPCLNLSSLAVNGKSLMQIGIPPGVKMGKTLTYLLDNVIKDPKQNTRETLLNLAAIYYKTL